MGGLGGTHKTHGLQASWRAALLLLGRQRAPHLFNYIANHNHHPPTHPIHSSSSIELGGEASITWDLQQNGNVPILRYLTLHLKVRGLEERSEEQGNAVFVVVIQLRS